MDLLRTAIAVTVLLVAAPLLDVAAPITIVIAHPPRCRHHCRHHYRRGPPPPSSSLVLSSSLLVSSVSVEPLSSHSDGYSVSSSLCILSSSVTLPSSGEASGPLMTKSRRLLTLGLVASLVHRRARLRAALPVDCRGRF